MQTAQGSAVVVQETLRLLAKGHRVPDLHNLQDLLVMIRRTPAHHVNAANRELVGRVRQVLHHPLNRSEEPGRPQIKELDETDNGRLWLVGSNVNPAE